MANLNKQPTCAVSSCRAAQINGSRPAHAAYALRRLVAADSTLDAIDVEVGMTLRVLEPLMHWEAEALAAIARANAKAPFPGMVICETNLLQELDEAALPRFHFKLNLGRPTREKQLRVLAQAVLDDPAGVLPHEQARQVSRLDGLTAGDFATVGCALEILERHRDLKAWVSGLTREHSFKRGAAPPMSFVTE